MEEIRPKFSDSLAGIPYSSPSCPIQISEIALTPLASGDNHLLQFQFSHAGEAHIRFSESGGNVVLEETVSNFTGLFERQIRVRDDASYRLEVYSRP